MTIWNKVYYSLISISLVCSFFYAYLFLYFNIDSSFLYLSPFIIAVLSILLFIFNTLSFFKTKRKRYIILQFIILVFSLYIINMNTNNIERQDVYTSIVSKKQVNQKYYITIENFGELSTKDILLKVSKSDYDKLNISRQRYNLTYRNYCINPDKNISILEELRFH